MYYIVSDNELSHSCSENELEHYGVIGMKWGKRKVRYSDDDIRIKKGSEIHRIMPKDWAERERKLKGHAYSTFDKNDTERYKKFARMFGDGNNYVDMSFKAKETLVSPSQKKRVDEFIKLIDSDPKAREHMIKATRNPLLFIPKKTYDNLGDNKKTKKAYDRFSYLLVSEKNLRDPYFDRLRAAGYNVVIDDADKNGGISKNPIIVFDREKTLKYDKTEVVGRK